LNQAPPKRTRTQHIRHAYVALLAVVAVLGLNSCTTLPVSATHDVCYIFNAKRSWHHAAVNMQHSRGVPLHVAMAVMYHESKFRKKAKPPRRYILGIIPWKRRSSAYGYAQAIDSTWESYISDSRNYGAQRTNFYDAMDFVGWYIGKSEDIANIPKTDPYNQYLAYHEGWTGFKRGTYNNKAWLQRVASEVASTSALYREQYNNCAGSLNRGYLSIRQRS